MTATDQLELAQPTLNSQAPYLEMAAALGVDVSGARPEDAGEILAQAFIRLMRETGLRPGIAALSGYGEADASALAEEAHAQQRPLVMAPRAVSNRISKASTGRRCGTGDAGRATSRDPAVTALAPTPPHTLRHNYRRLAARARLLKCARFAVPGEPPQAVTGDVREGVPVVRERPTVLVVDDTPANVALLGEILKPDYRVKVAVDGERALRLLASGSPPDLILLDIMMPGMDGYEVCRRLKANSATRSIPVIFVTSMTEVEDEARGLALGGVDYITKPVSLPIVKARVRTHLALHQHEVEMERMIARLEAQASELEEWNRTLEQRVAAEVAQVERLGRLKRFLSPSVVDLLLSGTAEDPLKSHRREIVAVFVDLRGFTAFTETSDPEDVMQVIREYHEAMGRLVMDYGGTLERYAGDGIMIIFNDPLPIDEPAVKAVRMALAMQERFGGLARGWRDRGYELAMGIGIAQGYATIGAIGFEGRRDYGAIGTVTNLAARLCGEAAGGQILVSRRVQGSLGSSVQANPVGELSLKGFHRPVAAYAVRPPPEAGNAATA
jgi:class 3 adenylate cyclase/CheY-like chemotaxis protein